MVLSEEMRENAKKSGVAVQRSLLAVFVPRSFTSCDAAKNPRSDLEKLELHTNCANRGRVLCIV
jgi:hypothetical protein